MTPKILPSELTSEERALFHHVAIGTWLGQPGAVNGESITDSFDAAMRYIEYQRQFFAPPVEASGKLKCCNCNQSVCYSGEHIARFDSEDRPIAFTCPKAPAQPEPEPKKKFVFECGQCGKLVETDSQFSKREPHGCTPAPQPAKRDGELPEAVQSAATFLRQYATETHSYPGSRYFREAKQYDEAADALETWARSLPTILAMGMTPELEMVLGHAGESARVFDVQGKGGIAKAIRADIAAVRAAFATEESE